VKLAPHIPANWDRFSIENLRVGNDTLLLNYKKEEAVNDLKIPGGIVLEVGRTSGSEECTVDFRPAISLKTKVQKVDLNSKPIPFRIEANREDQHVVVSFPVKPGKNLLRIYTQNEFWLSVSPSLPALGGTSQGLRLLSETWSPSKDQLTLEVSGAAGHEYELDVWNAGLIEKVEGAELRRKPGWITIWIQMPPSDLEPYSRKKVVIHFWAKVPPG